MTDTSIPLPSYKIVLLGDSSVGKTSLVHRFINNRFDTNIPNTIGAAFITKEYTSTNNKSVKLEIWDTAGQERYRSLTPMYYRNSKLALVCFDADNLDSFQKAKYWIDQLVLVKDTHDIKVVLVGNKFDLIDKLDPLMEVVDPFLQEHEFTFYKTSAKSGEGVQELFDGITNDIDQKFFEEYFENRNRDNSKNLNLIKESPYNSCC